ncbi:MAG: DUF5127 domain-containing protein, partial [Verrucomicrobiaceae bacterium]
MDDSHHPKPQPTMKPRRLTRSAALLMSATTLFSASASGREAPANENDLIPPSTPIIACDPYFSVWSPGDKLTDVNTTHWTGKTQPLVSVVRIDGKAHRVMGASPASIPALTQKDITVLPTRTTYTFEGSGITLDLSFTTPALPDDIAVLSRPVTYLTYDFRSTDGKEHEVSVYFGAGGELVVNNPDQQVAGAPETISGLAVTKMGSTQQKILGSKGDDHRIDWGYAYIAAPQEQSGTIAFGRPDALAESFAKGQLEGGKEEGPKRADQAGMGIELKPVKVGEKTASSWAMIAYDDIFAIQYNRKNLRAFWRKDGWEAKDLLTASAKEYDTLMERCTGFDKELMADMTAIGGEQYAKITALAYRQCFAAGKFVADDNGQPLQFSKENHSNG